MNVVFKDIPCSFASFFPGKKKQHRLNWDYLGLKDIVYHSLSPSKKWCLTSWRLAGCQKAGGNGICPLSRSSPVYPGLSLNTYTHTYIYICNVCMHNIYLIYDTYAIILCTYTQTYINVGHSGRANHMLLGRVRFVRWIASAFSAGLGPDTNSTSEPLKMP